MGTLNAQLASVVTEKPYKVKLGAMGNIDFDQDLFLPGVPFDCVEVSTFEEASTVCREYLDKYNLGAGNWIGGQVYDQYDRKVAVISYNGRICIPGDGYFEESCDPCDKMELKKLHKKHEEKAAKAGAGTWFRKGDRLQVWVDIQFYPKTQLYIHEQGKKRPITREELDRDYERLRL